MQGQDLTAFLHVVDVQFGFYAGHLAIGAGLSLVLLSTIGFPSLTWTPGWASAGDDVTGPAGTLASRGGVIPKGASPSLRRGGRG